MLAERDRRVLPGRLQQRAIAHSGRRGFARFIGAQRDPNHCERCVQAYGGRMSRLLMLCCILPVVGCGTSEPTATTASRFVTSVTWNASHQPVVATRALPLANRTFIPDSIVVDPACGYHSVRLSDKPSTTAAGAGLGGGGGNPPELDPTGNELCLADPGDTESVSLKDFPYPPDPTTSWAYHVAAFVPGVEHGGFFNDGSDGVSGTPCDVAFDYPAQVQDTAGTCAAIANGIEFDSSVVPVCTPDSYRCVGAQLQHCDGWSQWQSSRVCGASTLCSAGAKSCVSCPLPTCDAGMCGTVTNGCGSVACGGCSRSGYTGLCIDNLCQKTCHCRAGYTCDPDNNCFKL
jgi:hypothetical protein